MIRVAVVEDEAVYAEQLQGFLRRYQEESGHVMEVNAFTDGDEIAEQYPAGFDIIFMDIQMRFMDGMTAAKRIRQLDREVVIIFITNMAQYAIQGYSVDAFDYILKPVSYYTFSHKLDRALELLKRRENKYLVLRTDKGIARLSLNRIYYIEIIKRCIIVHAEAMDYSLTGTMKEMEERLLKDNFFRCNNCYLVNLSQVESVYGDEVTVGQRKLQISRPRRKAFLAALTDYMGGVAR